MNGNAIFSIFDVSAKIAYPNLQTLAFIDCLQLLKCADDNKNVRISNRSVDKRRP